jgi:hypothetical protein
MSVILGERGHPAHAPNFDVLHYVMVLFRTIVKFKKDPVRFNFELGNNDPVSRLGGDTVLLQLLRVGLPGRIERPICMEHDAASAQRKGTHGEGLVGLEDADKLLPCPLSEGLVFQLN